MTELTKRLKDLREDNDLNQTELAKKINSTQKTISNWEKGYSEPSIEMIKTLYKFFKVTSDNLIGLSDTNINNTTIKNQININTNKGKINMN